MMTAQLQSDLLTNISSLEILDKLKKQGYNAVKLAKKHGVNRSVIYQSINGNGSRIIRVDIAVIIGVKPSEIWVNNPKKSLHIDDLFYESAKNNGLTIKAGV